ncbi:MAG: ATP-binding protein, partial [Acidimicrobiia bacterium]
GRTFAAREQDRLISAIERDATVVASMSEEGLEEGQPLGLDLLLTKYGADPGGRIVVVDARGISVADSAGLDGPPRDFSTRPEFVEALAGRVDRGIRSSETLGEDLIFVAVPAGSGGSIVGAVRITYPATTLEDSVRDNWLRLGVLSLVVLAAVTIVGFTLARSVTRPVRALEATAAHLSAGNLAARVTVAGPPEIRELGRTFNETAEWLEALIDSQRGFVADASHQLRTPLTALRLRLENLRYAVDPEDLPAVEAALSETGRLTRLVDGLLALARAEAEHAPRQVVDLATIAADRAGVWEPLASDGGVTIVTELPATAPARMAPGATEQILDNLISNALDATGEGSAITIALVSAGDLWELHVSDEGPGMTDEQRAAAFDRFASDKGERGSGLGLSIVRQLARSGGGDARLQPSPSGGLDAVVSLPAATGPATAEEA